MTTQTREIANSMNGGIYKILNTVDGKQYIGSAVNFNRRKIVHWSRLRNGTHANSYLQSAWNKYGEDAFEFRVVGKCPSERLIELEQEVMDHLKPEYNVYLTAGSSLGTKRSEETKRKMSVTRTGKKKSDEHKRKLSAALVGIKRSEETKRKIGDAQVGKKLSSETKRKIGAASRAAWVKRKTIVESEESTTDA